MKPAAAGKTAAGKTAAAKPVKAAAPVAPATKPVEQSRPAAPVAPATRPVEKAPVPAPSAAPALAERAPVGPARPAIPAKAKPASGLKPGFKLSEFIVYPAHGVGQIVGVETQEVAGFSLELFVVSFIKDKMILKVPTSKVASVGMRKLAESGIVDKALQTLSGRARIKRTMWSRRAQEYEAKINSGDLITIAEVVRDLYRSDTQPEQSYSERQLYEAALDRMAREISAVRKLIDSESLKLIESFLLKGPRRGPKADGDVGDEGGDEADVDRAA
ncbi:MAG: CarD family transcriptional regulator [Alphaproteobacteria bacterium]|nr:CarD family transcriptional regulator [Alphaproteobacteria bacterium]